MTLVEIMLAAAIFSAVAFILVGLIHEYNLGSKRLSAAQHARADVAHLLDQWESDQSSADAVFIPDKDVLGADNTTLAHEVDFYSKDAANRPYYWAYLYDTAAHTLQRYDYPSPGAKASKDGNPFTAITRFAPSLHAIGEVTNASSPIYMPIFASAQNYDVPLGAGNKAVGGTHVVHVDLATTQETLPVELEAGGAPSGFTVVLNYTPMPRATPASSITVWPAFALYAASGTTLSSANAKPAFLNIASVINAILGGGVAQAAPPCTAQAYDGPGPRNPVKPGTPEGNLLGVTNAYGCFPGAMYVHESGWGTATNQFNYTAPACVGILALGPWNPGPGTNPAGLQGTGQATGTCSINISGNPAAPIHTATVQAQVMGATCRMSNGWHWSLYQVMNTNGTTTNKGSGWGATYNCAASGSYQKCVIQFNGSCAKYQTQTWAQTFPEVYGFVTTTISSSPTFPVPATPPASVISLPNWYLTYPNNGSEVLSGAAWLAGSVTDDDGFGGQVPWSMGQIAGAGGVPEPYIFSP